MTNAIAMNAPEKVSKSADKLSFKWADPLLLEELLSEDGRQVRDTTRAYAQEKSLPRSLEANRPWPSMVSRTPRKPLAVPACSTKNTLSDRSFARNTDNAHSVDRRLIAV